MRLSKFSLFLFLSAVATVLTACSAGAGVSAG
jgi:hypothetical protein